ncbi:MAG: hypothetical protein ACOH2Q_07155 [Rhodococcus sp. (in: high G+C Gram-positive bacteria)]
MTIASNERTALSMRIEGLTVAEIAAQLGNPDVDNVRAAITAELAASGYSHLPEPQAIHLLRLDSVESVLTAATTDSIQTPARTRQMDRLLAINRRERMRYARSLGASRSAYRADQGEADPTARRAER